MRRWSMSLLVLFLITTLRFGLAQQIIVVRVAVVAEDSKIEPVPNSTESAIWQRDLLVNYLNHQKPRKRSPVKVEAVPINTAADSYLFTEAKDKNCEFLIRLNIGSQRVNPDLPQTVSYSVLKVRDGRPVSSTPTFANAPREQSAMLLAGGIYDAIVKAAKP
jgi:hypothetical protein